ncbi:MAG TPA: hypothetical protein DCQ31_14185, partial [Bacteroidales bacterium]|nr:hypothetical protein [Bacteroidales bacterium]
MNDGLKDIPVLFLTCSNDKIDKISGFKAGAIDYINKPFDADELLARIGNQLKIHKLSYELKQKATEIEILNETLNATNKELKQQIKNFKEAIETAELHEKKFRLLYENA